MLKRLAATDFDPPLIGDLVATIVKPCNDFCNLSAVVIFFKSQECCSTVAISVGPRRDRLHFMSVLQVS